jgi:hypothetical protein
MSTRCHRGHSGARAPAACLRPCSVSSKACRSPVLSLRCGCRRPVIECGRWLAGFSPVGVAPARLQGLPERLGMPAAEALWFARSMWRRRARSVWRSSRRQQRTVAKVYLEWPLPAPDMQAQAARAAPGGAADFSRANGRRAWAGDGRVRRRQTDYWRLSGIDAPGMVELLRRPHEELNEAQRQVYAALAQCLQTSDARRARLARAAAAAGARCEQHAPWRRPSFLRQRPDGQPLRWRRSSPCGAPGVWTFRPTPNCFRFGPTRSWAGCMPGSTARVRFLSLFTGRLIAPKPAPCSSAGGSSCLVSSKPAMCRKTEK